MNKETKLQDLLPYIQIAAVVIILVGFLIISVNVVRESLLNFPELRFSIFLGSIGIVLFLALLILVFSRVEVRIPSRARFPVPGPRRRGFRLRGVHELSLEQEVMRYLKKIGIEKVYQLHVLEGERVSHEFDIIAEKEGNLYAIEIKRRLIVPSDLGNFSDIYDDLKVKNKKLKGIFIVTTMDATESVQRIAKHKGIPIINSRRLQMLKNYLVSPK